MTDYNDMVKGDLIDLAKERGLVSSKNVGRGISKAGLIEMLVQNDEDEASFLKSIHQEPLSESGQDSEAVAVMSDEEFDAFRKRSVEEALGATNKAVSAWGARPVEKLIGVDHGFKDHTAIVEASKLSDGTLVVDSISVLPVKPQTPKRYPHGAKSLGEVRAIEKFKKWRNKRRHKRSFSPWPNGQERPGYVEGFKWRRNIAHPDDLKRAAQ